jgi:enterochelin esterase-like enzyme
MRLLTCLFPFWLAGLLLLAACDPMAPQPTPVAVAISPEPSLTPIPRATDTATPTRTAIPTETPPATPTATPFPCDDDSGEIIDFTDFRSPTAGGENLRYRVYVPPCYLESQARFPYVILLHGLSYREQQWEDLGAIEALDQGIRLGALPPMILVMPYYGNIGQRNSFPPDSSYETVILDELKPTVESDLCTWNHRSYRAIGGISRGGFWAYSIAFRHLDVFGSVGGHSAVFPEGVREVPAAFNPLEIARNSAVLPEANLRMYMDNGAGDAAASSQRQLSNRLEERAIPHTYIIHPVGEHDNEYWSSHVSEYLAFYGRDWPRGYHELPSCLEPSPG